MYRVSVFVYRLSFLFFILNCNACCVGWLPPFTYFTKLNSQAAAEKTCNFIGFLSLEEKSSTIFLFLYSSFNFLLKATKILSFTFLFFIFFSLFFIFLLLMIKMKIFASILFSFSSSWYPSFLSTKKEIISWNIFNLCHVINYECEVGAKCTLVIFTSDFLVFKKRFP